MQVELCILSKLKPQGIWQAKAVGKLLLVTFNYSLAGLWVVSELKVWLEMTSHTFWAKYISREYPMHRRGSVPGKSSFTRVKRGPATLAASACTRVFPRLMAHPIARVASFCASANLAKASTSVSFAGPMVGFWNGIISALDLYLHNSSLVHYSLIIVFEWRFTFQYAAN